MLIVIHMHRHVVNGTIPLARLNQSNSNSSNVKLTAIKIFFWHFQEGRIQTVNVAFANEEAILGVISFVLKYLWRFTRASECEFPKGEYGC
jgi:hypothetical protein